MGEIKRVFRCHNCGAILQSENPNEIGYISKHIFQSETTPKIPYCNACYEKMILLNTSELKDKVDHQIVKILDDAVATDAFMIWVVDLFSFTGALNKDIAKKIRNLSLTVVGTKRDLFSSKIKDDTFKRFLVESFAHVGLKPQSINIVGDETDISSTSLLSSLNTCRKGHDVYMIGAVDSGKTTIINRMLKEYTNKSKWTIRSEIYPGTNVKVLEIPLSNSAFFYELPDLSLSTSTVSKVEKDILKQIIPHKQVNIFSKSLNVGESICVGNLAVISLIKGPSTLFRFYAAEGVEYKKVATDKVTDFFMKNLERKTVRPVSLRYTLFSDYDLFEYDMEKDGKIHDIYIEGLVTISFVADNQQIRITCPKGVALRECLAKVR